MPFAPNITCTNRDAATTATAIVAIRRRKAYTRDASGRTRSIHDAAKASACGARSTMARRPSSGRGNLVILENGFNDLPAAHSLENPMLRRRAQLLQTFFAARFGVDPHHRLGSRQSVANPRPVAEHQLQSVGAHDLADG